jgi:alanyl-tRNA synthetase
MTANEIRQAFLDFFAERAHAYVPSSPVVPLEDPTLLFTNAGMNQFKAMFLGTEAAVHARVANSQKCIRAGGKHNDLDDVGKDTYHHTFFEMLGNWSFGDYFKEEAIRWAWDLLHHKFGIPAERLHATYFAGDAVDGLEPDDEARDLWTRVTGIDPSHVHAFGKKDNFWEMAETGPCGPCTEIHVDLTPDLSGGPLVNGDDARVIEVWNLVFIQFNRDATRKLTRLPACHVDTGMGFERLVAVLQGKKSNYDTDVFSPLLEAIRKLTGAPAYAGTLPSATPTAEELRDVSYRVVADHLRTLSFAIADGAAPSNDGRGHVLRRILRRGFRYGRVYLGADGPFIHRLVGALAAQMGDQFPELRRQQAHIEAVIREEEESFGRTLDQGQRHFDSVAEKLGPGGKIDAETAFKLHDTYGFPIDLTEIIAAERGLAVDRPGYEARMEEAKELARKGGKFGDIDAIRAFTHAVGQNRAPFFETTKSDDRAKFSAFELDSELVGWVDAEGRLHQEPLADDQFCALVSRATPFYAEQGGQVGDHGVIAQGSGRFAVVDTQRVQDTVLHLGSLSAGRFASGQPVHLAVDEGRRRRIMANHSATHLLNLGLRNVLGEHVMQKGSLVDDGKTRFDFAHKQGLQPAEVEQVEALVEQRITAAQGIYDLEVELPRALGIHSLRAVFGEKYPEKVRVVAIGRPVEELLADPENPAWHELSIELCGGTHVHDAGALGDFCLISEEGIQKGVRRVVGITGEAAQNARADASELGRQADALSGAGADALHAGVAELLRELGEKTLPLLARQRLQAQVETLQAELKRQHKEASRGQDAEILERAAAVLASGRDEAGSRLLVADLPGAGAEQLRLAADWLRQKSGSAAVCLFATGGEKVAILAALTPDLVEKGLDARALLKEAGRLVGGGGGGKAELAQGGGKDAAAVPAAIPQLVAWLAERV